MLAPATPAILQLKACMRRKGKLQPRIQFLLACKYMLVQYSCTAQHAVCLMALLGHRCPAHMMRMDNTTMRTQLLRTCICL